VIIYACPEHRQQKGIVQYICPQLALSPAKISSSKHYPISKPYARFIGLLEQWIETTWEGRLNP
jgi:hypothetical protein